MNALADLLKIGLTEGEAKVYAALLELGSSSVGPITKRTKVSYSNIYEILDRLMQKGIVTVIVKQNTKYFQAVDPHNLSIYIRKKEEELAAQKELLHQALPRIQALQQAHPQQEAMLFTGAKGLVAAYKEFFRDATPQDENLWTYVHDDAYQKESDKFYLHTWFELAKDVKSRGIADTSYRKSRYVQEFQKKHHMKFVAFPIFSHAEVFKDRFLLISWEKQVTAVLVQAKHVSDNFKQYFEAMWQQAKP